MKNIFILSLTCLLIVGCSDKKASSATEETKEDLTQTTVELVAQEKTFGVTPEVFRENLVTQAKALGNGIDWNHVELEEGDEFDSFTIGLSKNATMFGVVDKNGELRAVDYALAQTDNLESDLTSLVMMGGMTAKAINPDIKTNEVMDKIVELLNLTASDFVKNGEAKQSVILDDIDYSAAMTTEGLWLMLKPKQ
ncbi:hypothetical protein VH441_03630 [Psychrobacter sp. HD31]|uniref:hypothetical protein n=1 Tax=Psychrobacter sp. HD31 TaxID=3112003 RepID=UPI003DA25698